MFLDTSGMFALLDAASTARDRAVALMNSTSIRLTHSYVLAEILPLGESRRLQRAPLIQFLDDLSEDPDVQIVWVTQTDHLAAIKLLKARRDKKYSLCDAVSFVLMRRFNLTDALTTDHHFEQEGFVRLLRP